MTEIVWEDPGPPKAGPGSGEKWFPILAPLMERPGEWARLRTGESGRIRGTAKNLTRRHGSRPDGFEFTCRVQDGGEVAMYARYVGGEP